jgi:hypothetical protein
MDLSLPLRYPMPGNLPRGPNGASQLEVLTGAALHFGKAIREFFQGAGNKHPGVPVWNRVGHSD